MYVSATLVVLLVYLTRAPLITQPTKGIWLIEKFPSHIGKTPGTKTI